MEHYSEGQSITIEELVKLVVEWVAANAERESFFLYRDPCWNIDAYALLDYIGEISGISREQMEKWSDK